MATTSTPRVTLHRERRERAAVVTRPFELSVEVTEMLVERGWLAPAGIDDKAAVSDAAKQFLEDWARI